MKIEFKGHTIEITSLPEGVWATVETGEPDARVLRTLPGDSGKNAVAKAKEYIKKLAGH